MSSKDQRIYIAIDLKSFYASVECRARGLDPMMTNLVVADPSRTEKTICLAVSPSLKAYGIPGRARLFEVVQRIREVNAERRMKAPGYSFTGKSSNAPELAADRSLEIDYIVAPPQMAYYIKVSTQIYNVYCRYISPDDIHVYSIDEIFIDATPYLATYGLTARELAGKLIHAVLGETGITATAGIGSNLYLCKITMDIMAKRMKADKDGVRIAELDEMSYRRELWDHRPLTDFWRVGKGYEKTLESNGLYTMGDIARCSIKNEDKLYQLFGVNAELLIDHAWGWEPCTIADIKAYKPESNSISSGQVLHCPYSFDKARLVVREMADQLSLGLVDKQLVTDQLVLTVGYDIENLKDEGRSKAYDGPITQDHYGRSVPKQAHGSINLKRYTSSTKLILDAISELYDRIVDKNLSVRRMYVVANRVVPEASVETEPDSEQLDLFTDYAELDKQRADEKIRLEKERAMQKALLSIKAKYGSNAILKGMNLEEGATAIDRNGQIGGHKA